MVHAVSRPGAPSPSRIKSPGNSVSIAHPDPGAALRCPLDRPIANRWLVFHALFEPAGLVDAMVEVHFVDGTGSFLRPTLLSRNEFHTGIRSRVPITGATIHVVGSGNLARPVFMTFAPENPARQIVPLVRRAVRLALEEPSRLASSARWFLHRMFETKAVYLPPKRPVAGDRSAHDGWIELLDERPAEDRALHEGRLRRLERPPLVSVLAAPDEPGEAELLLAELRKQIHPAWELIVAARDPGADLSRIEGAAGTRFVRGGPGRAASLNAALAAASGEIVAVFPAGARLRETTLLEAALTFAARPGTRLMFADEDRIDAAGRRTAPRFKTAWSPHHGVTWDAMADPVFYAADALREVGGWREGFSGAEDHDVKLRLTEEHPPDTIVHLAKVLLHRPEGGDEAPPQGPVARVAAEHLRRTGIEAAVVPDPRSPYPRVVRALPEPPLVSLIIPTRDRASLLRMCLNSILERTRYPTFEVIVVDNDSQEADTKALFAELEKDPRVRILPQPGPFNYSGLNNAAAREARGELLALVNNDIEVIAEDWLGEMAGYAVEERVGCVGAKLYYPDGTLQHGSVVVGLAGGAGHVHKHAPRDARGYRDRLVTVQTVSAVTAACLVVRKRVYEEVGGFDETRFKVALNDVDFCLKVAEAGYLNVWTPFAELTHHESVSRGNDLKDRAKAKRFAAELAALQEAWGVRLLRDPYYSVHLDWRRESGGLRLD
jgi:GT2 family glycosyltransferase